MGDGRRRKEREESQCVPFPSSPLTFSAQSKASLSLVTQPGGAKPVRGGKKEEEEEAAADQAAPPCRGLRAICALPAKP